MELTLKHWEGWMVDPALRKTEDRCRGVHGLSWASFVAAAEIYGVPGKADLARFRAWCVHHTIRSSGEVVEQVNVNVVWQHIINAFKSKVFGETPAEIAELFMARYVEVPHPPGAPSQDISDEGYGMVAGMVGLLKVAKRMPAWRSYTLYMDYAGVWDRLQEHWRHIGEAPPMTLRDFRAQMQAHPYFIKPKPAQCLQQRLRGRGGPVLVWGIKLDYHPMGYQPTADDVVLERFKAAISDGGEGADNWTDPRIGELYLLCYELPENDRKNTSNET